MTPAFVELPGDRLVPPGWAGADDIRVFNPTLQPSGNGGYVLFYRFVSPRSGRRIGACRLAADLSVIEGSVTDFSALIEDIPGWHADPRLFALSGGLYVTWNDGIPDDAENQQYAVQIDPSTLRPLRTPEPIGIDGPRRRVEKNWMFFEAGGRLHAVYSAAPHRILERRGNGWRFVPVRESFWMSQHVHAAFGEPRGGAQPVRLGNRFYSFCHGARRTAEGNEYVALVYAFEAHAPFRVTHFCRVPVDLPNPRGTRFRLPKLNPGVRSVIYPTGAVLEGERNDREWLIAYGLNDEAACLARVPHRAIEDLLEPVRPIGRLSWRLRDRIQKLPAYIERQQRRLIGRGG